MSDLNSISITGRVTKDAERKEFKTGTPYLIFDVANNTGFGEYAKTQFFRCMLVGKRADSMAQYLIKGKQVGVDGALESNNYTNYEGKEIKGWQLAVKNVVLLGGGTQQDLFDDGGEGDALKRQTEARYRKSSNGTEHEPLYEKDLY